MEENGVWRTIRGRRVFIKDGQSVSDAFKNSFKKPKGSGDTYHNFDHLIKEFLNASETD